MTTKQKLLKDIPERHSFDIYAITGSKRNEDHPVIELHDDYYWIGKDRIIKDDGGIGLLYHNKKISIVNDNLLNSKNDDFERMWVTFKEGKHERVLGIVYFPRYNAANQFEEAQRTANRAY